MIEDARAPGRPHPPEDDLPGQDPRGRGIRDASGQDLAEYGILASLIAIVVIVALTLVGTRIQQVFELIRDTLPFG